MVILSRYDFYDQRKQDDFRQVTLPPYLPPSPSPSPSSVCLFAVPMNEELLYTVHPTDSPGASDGHAPLSHARPAERLTSTLSPRMAWLSYEGLVLTLQTAMFVALLQYREAAYTHNYSLQFTEVPVGVTSVPALKPSRVKAHAGAHIGTQVLLVLAAVMWHSMFETAL